MLIVEEARVANLSLFRHYEDMESLFTTIDVTIGAYYGSYSNEGGRFGSLNERIVSASGRYAKAFGKLEQIILSTQAELWRSATSKANYSGNERRLRVDLERWLPEVAKLPKTRRETVYAVVYFYMWQRLSAHQGLFQKKNFRAISNQAGLTNYLFFTTKTSKW